MEITWQQVATLKVAMLEFQRMANHHKGPDREGYLVLAHRGLKAIDEVVQMKKEVAA